LNVKTGDKDMKRKDLLSPPNRHVFMRILF